MPKDNNKELTPLERVLDRIEVLPTLPRKQTLDSNYQRMILIKSNELCYAIGNAMNQDGRVYYKTSVSPDRLMRYTSNGQYSSMLKGEKGFGSHIGFEIANDIAIETMNQIAPILNYKLAEIYYEAYAETNRLFDENQRLLTQQNIFVAQQVNALKAKTKFLQEVYKDISQISKSDIWRQSTCTNLQRIHIELNEIFYNFISQINQGLILKNFNDVSGNHICARYALSHYIFALVLEYVAAGLIDNESMKFLKAKVEEAFDSFNKTTSDLERELNFIQNSNFQTQKYIWNNPFLGWWYDSWNNQPQPQHNPYQQNELNRLNNENINIEYIKNNVLSYFDIKRDREALFNLIEAPKQYLQNIVITHEE
ncbi:hypothetical protein DB320_05945 [Helicobacter pylori]|uniref:hypothetical protein n=1 Tax=Helicobacter pylori TaxID=210 RepID=UPI000EB33766|nr:hypothetical protein [Helicobacter pylori]RKU88482.1 hypothetical protein DB320_05945 [Helicobacter pylori]